MIKKTLTFENHDGETVTREYHFHMNKAELAEMQLSEKDGLAEKLRKILATKDGGLIMSTFKGLMLQTVGKRSEDGSLFRKTQDIRDEFEFSGAYSAMFMEMISSPNLALDFIKGIMPKDVVEKADFSNMEKLAAGATAKEPTKEEVTELQRLVALLPDPSTMVTENHVPETFRSGKSTDEMTVEELRAALRGRKEI